MTQTHHRQAWAQRGHAHRVVAGRPRPCRKSDSLRRAGSNLWIGLQPPSPAM